jgi:polyisoprenoid-binding protein YceI
MMKRLTLALAAVMLAPGMARATTYDIDPAHTTAEFVVKHMMVSNVHGTFKDIKGTVDYDEKNPANSKVNVEIATASIDTGVQKRDDHLKSPDFFDAAKNPTITFKSKSVKPSANGALDVTGDLTMHGVTKEVVLHVDGVTPEQKSPWGTASRGASATASLNRKDFGLTWNKALESGGVVVGDEVKLNLDVEMTTKPAGQAKK